MMFEMPDNNDMIDEISIQKLQEKLDVNISIKPKQRQANKSVLIKAQVRIVEYISTLLIWYCIPKNSSYLNKGT